MTEWTEADLHTDEASLHLYRTGTRGQRPVVLAHGLSDNGPCWWRVAEALGGVHDVLAYDARNHGLSSTSSASSGALWADLAAIIDHVGFDRPLLIGHSVGARTVAEFAATHPGVASKLVLIDPPWTAGREHDGTISIERTKAVRSWLTSLGQATEAELAELARTQHADWPDIEYPSWIASNQQVRPEAAVAAGGRGWGDVVAALDCPTLLLRGATERGGMVDEAVATRIVELSNWVEVITLPDAGHNLHRENFDGCMAAISGFLSRS